MRTRNIAWALVVVGIVLALANRLLTIRAPVASAAEGADIGRSSLRRLVAVAVAPLAGRAGLSALVVGDARAPAAAISAALLRETRMFVHVLAPTSTSRDALRREFGVGPSADRFAVAQSLVGDRLPYVDNLLNLLVVVPGPGGRGSPFLGECRRVLAPRGMLVLIQPRGEATSSVKAALRAMGFVKVRSEALGGWSATVARKPVPEGMDDWPQFLHGPDNNPVSHDRFVGPPRHLQWSSGPRWTRDHDVTPSVFGLVSAGGRIFYVVDEGPISVIDERLPEKRFLVARDAFNGALLWKYPLQNWYSSRLIWGHIPVSAQRRLVATPDRVYLTPGLGPPVIALDAATGRPVRTYTGTEHTSEIVLYGNLLLLVIRRTSPLEGKLASRDRRRFRPGCWLLPSGGEAVMAVDADTGRVLWRRPYHALPLTLCAGGGRVLFSEDDSIVCVDSRSGREVWRVPGRAETLVVADGVVIAGSWEGAPRGPGERPTSRQATLRALSLKDGRILWSRQGVYLPAFMFFRVPMDVFVTEGSVVWGLGRGLEWNKKPVAGVIEGLDLRTGAVRVERDMTGAFTPGHHVRCYKSKATDRYLLFNKRGIEFVETRSGKGSIQVRWLRGACRYGIMPANGLLYAPPHGCICYPETQLQGFFALSAGSPGDIVAVPVDARLERGPAWGEPPSEAEGPSPEDWPTYRHDPQRSGTCPTDVPPTLSLHWTRALGPGLTPPVCASGRVYVARRPTRTLFALEADTGEVLWRFVAGGEIDSPPTVWKDRVLFGSRDGRVYCLRASDGALVWSFLAARGERTVAREGRPESAWPVHGSVLLFRGLLYVVAGRTSEIDGGMDVYALDPASGSVVHHTRLVGPDEGTIRKAGVPITHVRMPGARNDILVTDGARLYLRHVPLDPSLPEKMPVRALTWGVKGPRHFLATSGFLDDTFFNRSVWQYGTYVRRSQMLVFDPEAVYGVRVYSGISWNAPIWNVGEGYLLFRRPFRLPKRRVGPAPRKGRRMPFRIPFETFSWHRTVHVLVRALVRVGRSRQSALLFVAGAPECIEPEDPFAAFEGRTEGRLLALDAYSGEVRSRMTIPAPPVFDGMIAARGRLLLTLKNGQVICLGAAPRPTTPLRGLEGRGRQGV